MEIASPAPYRINNVLGQTLLSGQMVDEIDVSELSDGVYFINVNGLVTKFVKASQR